MAQRTTALRQRLAKFWRKQAVSPAPEWTDLSLEQHIDQILSKREGTDIEGTDIEENGATETG